MVLGTKNIQGTNDFGLEPSVWKHPFGTALLEAFSPPLGYWVFCFVNHAQSAHSLSLLVILSAATTPGLIGLHIKIAELSKFQIISHTTYTFQRLADSQFYSMHDSIH